jgi:hypothetical protein
MDDQTRQLLAEAVKVLEGPETLPTERGDAGARYLVSTVLRTVSETADPGWTVPWAIDYLRKLQRPQESNAPAAHGEQDQEVYVAYQMRHWQDRDGWWFAVDIPGREREVHGHYSSEDTMLDAKVKRMEELEAGIIEP